MLLAIITNPASSDEPDVVVVRDLRHLERVLLRRAEYNGYGHTAVINWCYAIDDSPTCRMLACSVNLDDSGDEELVTVEPMVPGKTVVLRAPSNGDYYEQVN